MSLTRQEVFQALADGKDVEFRSTAFKWVGYYCGILNKETFDDYIWRIKPKPLEWYENIPEHGIFVKSKNNGEVIRLKRRIPDPDDWIPLTNEEIEAFKR
jgi:hypothetical protein